MWGLQIAPDRLDLQEDCNSKAAHMGFPRGGALIHAPRSGMNKRHTPYAYREQGLWGFAEWGL